MSAVTQCIRSKELLDPRDKLFKPRPKTSASHLGLRIGHEHDQVRVGDIAMELGRVKEDNISLRLVIEDLTHKLAACESSRLNEKKRSEGLVREIARLQERVAALLEAPANVKELCSSGPEPPNSRMLKQLLRSNQSLYRQAVFSTKRQILTEHKLHSLSTSTLPVSSSVPSSQSQALDYEPLTVCTSSLERDFATYLIATNGGNAWGFIAQFLESRREPERIENTLFSFLATEFSALAAWNRRVEKIVSDIEFLNSLSTNSIDSTLVTTTDTIRQNIDCDRASVWMVDHSGTNEAWTRRLDDSTLGAVAQYQELRIPNGVGLVGTCFNAKGVINIADAYHDIRFDQRTDKRTGYHTKSVLCVPIMKQTANGGKIVISVIQAINKRDGKSFTKQDEQIVHMFGSVASSVVNHCELFAKQEADAKRNDLLMECIIPFIDSPMMNLEDLLKHVRRSLHRLIRSIDCSITYREANQTLTRYHLEESTLRLTSTTTEEEDSACTEVFESGAHIQTDPLHLNPLIDIPVNGLVAVTVYTYPISSGEAVIAALQFVVKDSGMFSVSQDSGIVKKIISCTVPHLKRLFSKLNL